MGETEVGRPGHVNSKQVGPSPSQREQPGQEEGEFQHPQESGGNPLVRNSEASPPVRRGNTGQSEEVKDTRQKRSLPSSSGSSSRPHHRSGNPEEKSSGRPPSPRKRRREEPESPRARRHHRRESRRGKARPRDRRSHPGPPERTLLRLRHPCSGDPCGAPSSSPKRRRPGPPLSPAARGSPGTLWPLSRVISNVGALEVALEDLQAPGGAFLRAPSSSTEPSVSQRAWLAWQLSHAGASLHWALHTVDSILAGQAWLPRYT